MTGAFASTDGRHPSVGAGFTLIEVMVVIIILSLIATLSIPAFRGPARTEDDMIEAVRRVDELFRLARDSAIRGGAPVTVLVDSITANFWLLTPGSSIAGPAPTGSIRSETQPELARGGIPLRLPSSVTVQLTRRRARFAFMPTGAALADSITLVSGATELPILVDPWTGDVALQ